MHASEKDANLDTDVKKVAETEASIQRRLENAKKKADDLLAQARAQRLEMLEKTEEKAAEVRESEAEKIRKQVSAECQSIFKSAETEAGKIEQSISKNIVNKLLEEFELLAAKEARG